MAVSETGFVISLALAEDVGMTTMMTSSNIVVGYIVSIIRYHEQINIFCLLGSIFIVVGLTKIVLHS